jgi:biopolymer transport protein ExbD
MPFGGFERHGATPQRMSEINVPPLVDVMLVLLVIFIITAPLLTHGIRLDLPNETAPAAPPEVSTVRLSIDGSGQIYWDAEPVTDEVLRTRLEKAGSGSAPPEVHLRADKETRYERIAFVLAAAQQAGLTKIGFITEPVSGAAAARP